MTQYELTEISKKLAADEQDYEKTGAKITGRNFAGFTDAARSALVNMITAMFPEHFGEEDVNIKDKRTSALALAEEELEKALSYVCEDIGTAQTYSDMLFEKLPDIMSMLKTDLIAAYQGDPAAKSVDEIILSYPAFTAISAYRIAHELYLMKIPVLPRMLTEYAHEKTGIDIHPGATIGAYFFIDHGTGVVIGETTTIGEHVKLYQHVTLGAKSFAVAPDGTLVKGIKRHPDIGNNVVIYAGATLLGGDTVIGDDCVIGGNVWLTHSVPAGQTVTMRE